MTLEAFLARLKNVRRKGSGWQALCPAQEDRNPSLSIDVREGKILIHCHAGCSQEAVLAALKIKARELSLDAGGGEQSIVAEYNYTDENSGLLFQVVRLESKGFRQRRLDENGRWNSPAPAPTPEPAKPAPTWAPRTTGLLFDLEPRP